MSSEQADTRTKILEATIEWLEATQGQGVRMGDVAQRSGISRQAVYLHFSSRTELLIEATLYVDRLKGAEERLRPSREAETGIGRLDAFIEAWGTYIPEIHSMARALMIMSETDEAAKAAWDKRMLDLREGCEAAIKALEHDGILSANRPVEEATDMLWMMLSIRNWEALTIDRGWPQKRYLAAMKAMARTLFVAT